MRDRAYLTELVELAAACPPKPPRGLVFAETATLRCGPDYEEIDSVAISPDGTVLATGGCAARLWRLPDGAEIGRLDAVRARSLVFTPDGRFLAGTGRYEVGPDAFALLWEVPSGRLCHTLKCSSAWGEDGLAMSPDGTVVAVGGGDGLVRIWELATGAVTASWAGPNWGARQLDISPDGRLLAVGAGDGRIDPPGHGCARVWELRTGTPVVTIDRDGERIDPVAFVGNERLAGVCGDGRVRLWELSSGATHTFDGDPTFYWRLKATANLLLAGGYDRTLRVWDVTTGRQVASRRRTERVPHVATDAEGTVVVTGDLAGGVCWSELPGAGHSVGQHRRMVCSVAVSPDGRTVVSGHDDGTAVVWRPALELVAGTPGTRQDPLRTYVLADRAKRAPEDERAWLELVNALARGAN
jgi:WD40 repeat protein